MSCYYLIASLPLLMPDQKPPLSSDAFKALCCAQLNDADRRAVIALCDGPDYGDDGQTGATHPFVAAWQAREIQIRNAIARSRAERRKTDAAGSIRSHSGFDSHIEEAVVDAFDRPSPLEREHAFDRLRWQILDELAGVDPFATSVVMAYAVKLRIAQRWAALDTDSALKRVESTLVKVMDEGAPNAS